MILIRTRLSAASRPGGIGCPENIAKAQPRVAEPEGGAARWSGCHRVAGKERRGGGARADHGPPRRRCSLPSGPGRQRQHHRPHRRRCHRPRRESGRGQLRVLALWRTCAGCSLSSPNSARSVGRHSALRFVTAARFTKNRRAARQ